MRKGFALALAALLCGCSAAPEKSTATTPPSTPPAVAATSTAFQPRHTVETIPPASPSSTIEYTSNPTPAPYMDPASVATIPDFLNGEPDKGLRIGNAVIASGDFIYYYKPGDSSEDTYILYEEDKRTGEKRVLREIEDNAGCMGIFLDAAGELYYLSCGFPPNDIEDNAHGRLYKYKPEGDILISRNVNKILRVDSRFIYYAFENFQTQKSGIYKYDIKTGESLEILSFDGYFYDILDVPFRNAVLYCRGYMNESGNNNEPSYWCVDLNTGIKENVFFQDEFIPLLMKTADGEHVVQIIDGETDADVIITNYRALSKRTVKLKMTQAVANALIVGNTLYVISYNEDWAHCSIHAVDIDSGKTEKIAGKIGFVSSAQHYDGNWYILANEIRGDSGMISGVKVLAFDEKTRRIKSIKTYSGPLPSYSSPVMEIEAGRMWIMKEYDGDASPYDLWQSFRIE